MNLNLAWQICLLFGGASLLSIGGGNSVVPEIELRAVSTYHWLDGNQFADLFAIAQTAPGPSILLVTLVGYAAAGVLGALLATLAMVFRRRSWSMAARDSGTRPAGPLAGRVRARPRTHRRRPRRR